ncbi:aminotransferase class I/II-fold pyridoxal phosphate-dependent enzyme [Gloeobacter morelensis]|uniref:Methionine gamma-lyase family protein n=1 Tax=Gloeobacter morelensis MG652769 TaxID=2781736 RepID=A0ABY3PQU3_9CYAN|nr:methionine gamma-lyase family protein [Gloeobacter morelensis]UFP95894.1 methionine gamma-lyase family protein [Gloeobacter morelensis MG652769]
MSTVELFVQARQDLAPVFAAVDNRVKKNLQRVLAAYRTEKIGAHHFAGVSGYGHGDLGRDTLDRAFARIFGAEQAAVRIQFVSGTHAITCALFGVLRPGDELLSVAGAPYDTLEEVIGLRGHGQGSLKDFGVAYREVALTPAGRIDWEKLASAVRSETRMVLIQRSCGYSWRPSVPIGEIERVIALVKAQNPDTVCFVDNCYGEFCEDREPTHVGADLVAGSLIKNPGGTIAPAGGYLAGKAEWVERACARLTAPGIGSEGGSSLDTNRLLMQGLFLAPQMVGEAMKGAHLASYIFSQLGYAVQPAPTDPRTDVIQALRLGSPEKLVAFCRAIQRSSPIDSYLEPVPDVVPGYADAVVMAGGTFIEGSTLELSADGPLREPYIVFLQGGTHLAHVEIALEAALEVMRHC